MQLVSLGSDGRIAIAKAFKKQYGIDMESITGRTGEIDTKIIAERSAGLYLEDLYLAGVRSAISNR